MTLSMEFCGHAPCPARGELGSLAEIRNLSDACTRDCPHAHAHNIRQTNALSRLMLYAAIELRKCSFARDRRPGRLTACSLCAYAVCTVRCSTCAHYVSYVLFCSFC